MRGVRDGLEALELTMLSTNVVFEHPEVTALLRVWLIIFIMAI